MIENKTKNKLDSSSLPQSTKSYVLFVEVLFGLVIAVAVTEVPLSAVHGASAFDIVIYSAIFATTLFRMVMHWWAVQFDSAIAVAYFRQLVPLGYYFLAVIIAIVYFSILKLAALWIADTHSNAWAIYWCFLVICTYRLIDVVAGLLITRHSYKNQISVAGLKDKTKEQLTNWYSKITPMIIIPNLFYSVLLVLVVFFELKIQGNLLVAVLVYALLDISNEIRLYRGRRKLTNELAGC